MGPWDTPRRGPTQNLATENKSCASHYFYFQRTNFELGLAKGVPRPQTSNSTRKFSFKDPWPVPKTRPQAAPWPDTIHAGADGIILKLEAASAPVPVHDREHNGLAGHREKPIVYPPLALIYPPKVENLGFGPVLDRCWLVWGCLLACLGWFLIGFEPMLKGFRPGVRDISPEGRVCGCTLDGY